MKSITDIGRYFVGILRSRRVILVSIVAGTFMLAACTTNAPASPAASGSVPTEHPVGSEVPAASGNGHTPAVALNPAPDFQIELFGNANNTKGDVVTLDTFEGHPLVVNFWFPSCPPCRAEMPDLQQTFEAHMDEGLEFIGVQLLGLDSVQEGQEFIDDFGITYSAGPDDDNSIVKNYDVIGFPTTVFLDKDHNIVRKWTGPLNHEKLEELVAEILG